ncbi:GIY-YIG nuclease family protein [uncultured Sphingomonas sp.]|uniref:GIY-YIG nuclease family protein n=1 Tax=uncultured Sphingomonas sp. TaxID=158754 RepID=UPI00345C4380
MAPAGDALPPARKRGARRNSSSPRRRRPISGRGREGYGWIFSILANPKNGALYAGVTKIIRHRIVQHCKRAGSVHAERYDLYPLIDVEEAPPLLEAIAREKR